MNNKEKKQYLYSSVLLERHYIKLMKSLTNLLKSKVLINEKKSFIDNAIGVFTKDPVSVMKLFEEIRTFPSRIRDEIYWENFETYLFHVYDYDTIILGILSICGKVQSVW